MIQRIIVSATFALLLSVVGSSNASAHCQIPCGIYGDHARVHEIHEDIRTIAKAMNQIRVLSAKKDAQSQNQLVRWVTNKEKHAENIIRIISDYFMAQKIKPKAEGYRKMLVEHHAVMRAAMKAKQVVSADAVEALKAATTKIEKYWITKKK